MRILYGYIRTGIMQMQPGETYVNLAAFKCIKGTYSYLNTPRTLCTSFISLEGSCSVCKSVWKYANIYCIESYERKTPVSLKAFNTLNRSFSFAAYAKLLYLLYIWVTDIRQVYNRRLSTIWRTLANYSTGVLGRYMACRHQWHLLPSMAYFAINGTFYEQWHKRHQWHILPSMAEKRHLWHLLKCMPYSMRKPKPKEKPKPEVRLGEEV